MRTALRLRVSSASRSGVIGPLSTPCGRPCGVLDEHAANRAWTPVAVNQAGPIAMMAGGSWTVSGRGFVGAPRERDDELRFHGFGALVGDLTGTGRAMTAPAVGEAERADVDL